MKRDVLSTYTPGKHVTDHKKRNTSIDLVSTQLPTIQTDFGDVAGISEESNYPSNKTKLVGRQFYNSYDPEVGINTAGFLGGILVVLVLYVIYRTKCRKRILGFFEKCKMKYFPEEFPQTTANEQSKPDVTSEGSHWISESAKMIWKERANLSRDSESCIYPTSFEQLDNGAEESFGRRNSLYMQLNEHVEPECDMNPPKLPDSEENIEKATAYWVQNVKNMDMKERQLNGIVLKIPPDLVSHYAKKRSHFHSVTDYGDLNELLNISQRNKSLPSLVEQKTCVKFNYANIPKDRSSGIYVPLATQEEDFDLQPLPLKVKHSSGSKVPLDICPIVKVQHYHSRSKRRLTSLCRSSSDEDMSSSSSEEHHVVSKSLSSNGSDAKYMRLDTTECISTEDGQSSQRRLEATVCSPLTDSNIPLENNHSKRSVFRSLETNL